MPEIVIFDKTGNPAPLGLMGFGMTTILLNLHNAGLLGLDTMILSMGIFYGGLAQIIAGIMEWKKGNTFACTAFISYGMFWLSLVSLIALPKAGLGLVAPSGLSMPIYLGIWCLFTAGLFFGTLRLNRALQVVFGSLTVLFFMLVLGDALGSTNIARAAGWEGLFCGASACYAGLAQILNDLYGRTVCPLGPVIQAKSLKLDEIATENITVG